MNQNEIQKKLEALLPSIRQRREEIEQARRLPRDLVDALIGTGVFTLGIPRAVGGQEADMATMMRAVETIATADGSAGWCTMIGLTGNLAAGYMNEPGAKEIFADATVVSAAVPAPAGAAIPVDGGYRITGRWPFGSGITHSDWVWGGCLVMEDGAPKMTPQGPMVIHPIMPTSEIEIHDTWHVSGLAGTGSNDFSATDVFVPEQRIFSLFDPSGHRAEPLYQIPIMNPFLTQVASVALGIARGALDELIELAMTKKPSMSEVVLADKPVAQVEIARAEAALAAARAFLYASIGELEEVAHAGGVPTMRQRAMNRTAGVHAVETAASVTRTVNVLGGGSSLYSSSPLQRHMRDAEATTHHFVVAQHTWEEAGRVLLGRDPTLPLF